MTLAEFLLARITEDEQAARSGGHTDFNCGCVLRRDGYRDCDVVVDPRRAAEAEAKQWIVELHPAAEHRCPGMPVEWIGYRAGEPFADWWCRTLCAIALPYASHPDYNEAWKP